MKITLIEPRGFCFGVCRALEMLDSVLSQKPYVLHDIIHNKQVVNRYKEKGVTFVDDLDDVPKGAHLVLSAHGVSRKIEAAAKKDFVVIDTTCPFVRKNHLWVQRLEAQNIPIILIGKSNHIEVVGTLGQLQNPKNAFVVSCVKDVDFLPVFSEVGAVIQTTFCFDTARQVIQALHKKYEKVFFQKGICNTSEERQAAVRVAAKTHQMILVVGDKSSSNARRLVDVAKNAGADSILVETPDDLKNVRFPDRVAITSAASAPEEIVEQVLSFLKQY